jgi:hypothetical protein
MHTQGQDESARRSRLLATVWAGVVWSGGWRFAASVRLWSSRPRTLACSGKGGKNSHDVDEDGCEVKSANREVRVLISYAHGDADHEQRVRRFWALLRAEGVDAKLDVAAQTDRRFWPEWMAAQIRSADFVLMVASSRYRERAEGKSGGGSVGRGVRWESRLLQEWLYSDADGVRRIVPVVLPGDDVAGLPNWVYPAGGTTFQIAALNSDGVDDLVRLLTGQPSYVEPPLGTVRTRQPQTISLANPASAGEPANPTSSPEILDFDVRQDGLFSLGVWSPARRLEPSRLLTEFMPAEARPTQRYIEPEALAAAVEARSRTASGATVYLTGFRIDHRESDDTQYCRIHQAPSIYPEVLAVEDLRIQHPELFEECDSAIGRDVRDYLRGAVPSSLAVNLVVLSAENDELLCVERSAAVDSAVGWWTVGVFETMKQPDVNRPGAPEDIYGLATRGLNEELGLQHSDYNPIQISWVGIYRPILRGHVVAVLKLRITKGEAHARARAAHSGYEHAAIEWIPLRKPLVRSFVEATRSTRANRVGSTLEIGGRTWIEQSRLAMLEAWRFRNALEN